MAYDAVERPVRDRPARDRPGRARPVAPSCRRGSYVAPGRWPVAPGPCPVPAVRAALRLPGHREREDTPVPPRPDERPRALRVAPGPAPFCSCARTDPPAHRAGPQGAEPACSERALDASGGHRAGPQRAEPACPGPALGIPDAHRTGPHSAEPACSERALDASVDHRAGSQRAEPACPGPALAASGAHHADPRAPLGADRRVTRVAAGRRFARPALSVGPLRAVRVGPARGGPFGV